MAEFSEYPHMIFVDGENFTIRGQQVAKAKKIDLVRGANWEPDTFLWFPGMNGEFPEFSRDAVMASTINHADIRAERAYYYTSVQGDERKLQKARLAIRKLGFDPNVFKKKRGAASKGVDISLATDVVSLAYRQAYKVAYLIAGDGDYVPLVEEAKRAGARVVVAFFEKHGLNDNLRVAADHFIDVTESFVTYWRSELAEVAAEAKVDALLAAGVDTQGLDQALPDATPGERIDLRNRMIRRKDRKRS
jgi:uncharacterized LabA/DUF88 family protein